MGDGGYIYGYLLLFMFFFGGLVGSVVSYYILKDEKENHR